jgi:hypothetical protein
MVRAKLGQILYKPYQRMEELMGWRRNPILGLAIALQAAVEARPLDH